MTNVNRILSVLAISQMVIIPILSQTGILTPAQPLSQSVQTSGPVSVEPTRSQVLAPEPVRPGYILGVEDQISIHAAELEEINDKAFVIGADGYLKLPLLGRIQAEGKTISQLEADLVERIKEYVREPQVIVTVLRFRATPVFLVGHFRTPGIYALQGQRTLLELLTQAGGLQAGAKRRIRLTRKAAYGPIPLPGAVVDAQRGVSQVEVNMTGLQDDASAADNLMLQPYDVITAEKAEMVYVTGAVNRAGGIELGERDSMLLTQVLVMSGGIARNGERSKVRILRPVLDTNRRAEIEVDLRKIYSGQANDFPLMPNDYVYVPTDKSRAFATTTLPFLLAPLPYLLFSAL